MDPAPHPFDRPDIDALWVDCARRAGFTVVRGEDAYASTSRATMTIGAPHTLDADDCLAVLVLHELCHGLVEGPERWQAPDFGLDNTSDDDRAREYAALRLQAYFADRQALRAWFFPTTEWRPYYDDLPPGDPFMLAPFSPPTETSVIAAAKAGVATAKQLGVYAAIDRAVAGTLEIARSQRITAASPGRHPISGPLIDWRHQDLRAETQKAAHMPTCGGCAWAAPDRFGKRRCVVHAKWNVPGPRVRNDVPGCIRFEKPLDCQTCGACCREAYQAVQIPKNDPFISLHPELVAREKGRVFVIRQGKRCSQLEGPSPYGCRVYQERPITCREFQNGEANCLLARRRVGLSA